MQFTYKCLSMIYFNFRAETVDKSFVKHYTVYAQS